MTAAAPCFPPARWVIALSLAWLAGCAPLRYGDALLVLGDLAAGEGPSRLKQVTPEPDEYGKLVFAMSA